MQNMDHHSTIQTIGTGLLIAGISLTPLLVLPLSDQPIIDSKILISLVITLVFLSLFTLKSWFKKTISFLISPLSIPLLLFGVATLAASFFTGNYPVEHLLGMGGVLISIVVMISFGADLIDKDTLENWLPLAISVVGGLLAIASILQIFGFGPSHLLNLVFPIDFPANALFNLAGSALIASQVFIVFLVGLGTLFITGKKTGILEQVGVVLMVGGLLLTGWAILPGKPAEPTLLPHTAAWSVGIDTLKSPRTALIGFGPEGFTNAFSIYKPNWMNGTEQWNIQFSQGSNAPFTILVTMGLLGLIAWVLIAYTLIRQTKEVTKRGKVVHYMLLATLVLQLLLPITTVMMVLQGFLLLAWVVLESGRFSHIEIYGLTIRNIKNSLVAHPLTNNQKMVTYVFTAVMILIIAGLTYGVGRAYAAHAYTVRSIAAAQRNDAITVYNTQQKAVALNPYVDEMRRRYATTNLVIASAIAQKTDRTEQEDQQFAQLVQQSIREARAATLLDPLDTNNWTNLAQIYRALIGVADSADQWAVDSYVSAIQTAPQNPVLRVELGGIFFRSEDYSRSAQFFQQAIDLKLDYANAYYNLANAFAESGQLENAKVAYQATLQLVPADSEDYIRATEELANVEQLLSQSAAQAPQADVPPAPAQAESIPDTTSAQFESPLDTVNQPGSEPLNIESVETSDLNAANDQNNQSQTNQPETSAQ
jgi:tetratricopeptide (TPR) repeat protein